MKLIYKKKSHIKCDFFCIFQKKAVPLSSEWQLGTFRRRDVAQPGSATVWGTGGRKFKSCHPDKYKMNVKWRMRVVIAFILLLKNVIWH